MNFLGMGPLEILVVLFIAFVVLGPERMADMGKKAGRLVGDLRRMNSGLRETLNIEGEDARPAPPAAPEKGVAAGPADGPVAFRAGGETGGDGAPGEGPDSSDGPGLPGPGGRNGSGAAQ